MSAPAPLIWILALVIVQRLGELIIARRNTQRLMAEGAREIGAGHYPLFILLHASWLAALALTTPLDRPPFWPLIGVYALLQVGRLWVILTLGRFWTTRIIAVDHAPLVRKGPFRFVRHPNYWVVCLEIAVLPLAFANWPVAVLWSVLNALLLRHRIRVETLALDQRAALASIAQA